MGTCLLRTDSCGLASERTPKCRSKLTVMCEVAQDEFGDIGRNPPRLLSIRGVVSVCRVLPETAPATGSNCKSRDYRRVCYRNGSTPRMWGIGSPSTQYTVPVPMFITAHQGASPPARPEPAPKHVTAAMTAIVAANRVNLDAIIATHRLRGVLYQGLSQ